LSFGRLTADFIAYSEEQTFTWSLSGGAPFQTQMIK